MSELRARYVRDLEQQLSSMVAQIEVPTPNTAKDEEKPSTANAQSESQNCDFLCDFPGCADAAAGVRFNTKHELEEHETQHVARQYNCTPCRRGFGRRVDYENHQCPRETGRDASAE